LRVAAAVTDGPSSAANETATTAARRDRVFE